MKITESSRLSNGSNAAAWMAAAFLLGAVSSADGGERSTNTVSGRYRSWWSQGVDGAPYAPLPSCAQIFADGSVRLGFCPFSFDGTVLSNQRTRWTAVTPCIDNLIRILWIGSGFDASNIDPHLPDAISAIGTRVDLINGDSFAFQGFRDESCEMTDGQSPSQPSKKVSGLPRSRCPAPIPAAVITRPCPPVFRHPQPPGPAPAVATRLSLLGARRFDR